MLVVIVVVQVLVAVFTTSMISLPCFMLITIALVLGLWFALLLAVAWLPLTFEIV